MTLFKNIVYTTLWWAFCLASILAIVSFIAAVMGGVIR
jgi:hypothetical protein